MWRIGTALTLATSLHAVVLGGALQWGQASTGSPAAPSPSRAALQVRTVHLSPPEVPVAHVVPAPVEGAPEPAVEARTEAATQAPLLATDPVIASDVPPAPSTSTSPAPAPEPTAATAAVSPALAATPDVYHARRELSRTPKPLGPIDITFPPGVPTPGRHSAVLAIYIDEAGTVRKVQPVDAPLPDAFEEAARNAFLAARFRAGEREGRLVKSFIHIEVVFEERPESRGLALSGLGQSSH